MATGFMQGARSVKKMTVFATLPSRTENVFIKLPLGIFFMLEAGLQTCSETASLKTCLSL